MSQFRALAGVLRSRGCQWLLLPRGGGGGGGGGGPACRSVLAGSARSCFAGPTAPTAVDYSSSSSYVEGMYFAWLEDPKNVHEVMMMSYLCTICTISHLLNALVQTSASFDY